MLYATMPPGRRSLEDITKRGRALGMFDRGEMATKVVLKRGMRLVAEGKLDAFVESPMPRGHQ